MPEDLQQPIPEEQTSKNYRSVRRTAIIATCLYAPLALFITAIFVGIMTCLASDYTKTWSKILSTIFFNWLLSSPVPIPLYKTWSRYLKMRNKSIRPLLLISIVYYVAVILFSLWVALNT